jgi:hypothetical protein
MSINRLKIILATLTLMLSATLPVEAKFKPSCPKSGCVPPKVSTGTGTR